MVGKLAENQVPSTPLASESATHPVATSARCGSTCGARISVSVPITTAASTSAVTSHPTFFVSTSSRAETGSRNSVRMPGPSYPQSMRFRPASEPSSTIMGMNPKAAVRAGERKMSATAVIGTTASW